MRYDSYPTQARNGFKIALEQSRKLLREGRGNEVLGTGKISVGGGLGIPTVREAAGTTRRKHILLSHAQVEEGRGSPQV
jgi:hypothetical protein